MKERAGSEAWLQEQENGRVQFIVKSDILLLNACTFPFVHDNIWYRIILIVLAQ